MLHSTSFHNPVSSSFRWRPWIFKNGQRKNAAGLRWWSLRAGFGCYKKRNGWFLVQVGIFMTYAAQSSFSSSAFHIPLSLSRRAVSSAIGSSISSEGDTRSILLTMGYFLNNELTNSGKQTIKVCGPSRKHTSLKFQTFDRSKNNFGKIHILQRMDSLRFFLYPFIFFWSRVNPNKQQATYPSLGTQIHNLPLLLLWKHIHYHTVANHPPKLL